MTASKDALTGRAGREPFRYSEPDPVDELIDRDAEATLLRERAEEGNNSWLLAPRRSGRTSLVRPALQDTQHDGGRRRGTP